MELGHERHRQSDIQELDLLLRLAGLEAGVHDVLEDGAEAALDAQAGVEEVERRVSRRLLRLDTEPGPHEPYRVDP